MHSLYQHLVRPDQLNSPWHIASQNQWHSWLKMHNRHDCKCSEALLLAARPSGLHCTSKAIAQDI